MQTVVEKIDREKAEAYLKHNVEFASRQNGRHTNRPINAKTINDYARAMLRGEWRLTHQGIAFANDRKKTLLDGQQRLMAVVLAAETDPKIVIEFTVTRDVPMDTFDVMDIGRFRSAGQILAMDGESNPILLASSARALYLYDNVEDFHEWRKYRVTNHQIKEIIDNTTIRDFAQDAIALRAQNLIATAGTTGLYIIHRANPVKYDVFVDLIKTGIGIEETNDPIYVFRQHLTRSRPEPGKVRRDISSVHMAMLIKTFNDWVLGRKRDTIMWRRNEPMPKPVESAK